MHNVTIFSCITASAAYFLNTLSYCGPCATKCNVWPGANLGFILTGVVCYCTLPEMRTQWPNRRRGSVWPSVTTFLLLPIWPLAFSTGRVSAGAPRRYRDRSEGESICWTPQLSSHENTIFQEQIPKGVCRWASQRRV